jgi:hypothetical protein
MHGRKPDHVRVERSVPRGRDVQHVDGRVLESDEDGRDIVLGRERVHADRHVRRGDVHGRGASDVCGERSVPRGGELRSGERRVLESGESERYSMLGWKRLHPE